LDKSGASFYELAPWVKRTKLSRADFFFLGRPILGFNSDEFLFVTALETLLKHPNHIIINEDIAIAARAFF